MNRWVAVVGLCLVSSACASAQPAREIVLEEVMEVQARPAAERPVPVEVIEVPRPLPLPGQLKPVPQGTAMHSAVNPRRDVVAANSAARIEPVKDGFVNAVQVWPYSDGALYQVYASPGRVTDLALQPGEELVSVSAGDTVRWIIGDTVSGSGAEERVHVLVKPSRGDLQTNLVITTNRRSYHLELSATPQTWMASVSWEYPGDLVRTLRARNRDTAARTPVGEALTLEQLRFRYVITGDAPAWRPLRAFDDGRKVYIQFPQGIAQGELPPVFVIGADGGTQLVNYRVRLPYIIVDRLFGVAELRLGSQQQQVVRIERSDERTRRR